MRALAYTFFSILLTNSVAWSAERGTIEFTGVMTVQLLPAKIIRINENKEDPDPGTSYIGDVSILEVKENPEVISNWSIVTINYLDYEKPKIIKYDILSEQYEITVRHRAISLEVIGDLSEYVSQ